MPSFQKPGPHTLPGVTPSRTEENILSDLRALCTSAGYAHALAKICLRNDWVPLSKESTSDNYSHLYDTNHLTLTEVATLTLLLATQPVDLTYPGPDVVRAYVQSTHALLEELHASLRQHFIAYAQGVTSKPGTSPPPLPGAAFREPYFYTAPTAYYYQYRDLALTRYLDDDPWLSSRYGFTIGECQSVLSSLTQLQHQKINHRLVAQPSSRNPLLDCFSFDTAELSQTAGLDSAKVKSILTRFTFSTSGAVPSPASVHDFNPVTAQPILSLPNGRYVLFQFYWLFESLYVSPAYWMRDDTAYRPTAAQNRGKSAETLVQGLMERVFGDDRVHRNVHVYQGKDRIGEIDVLAVFGDRAVAIEAKAKGLTIPARKGILDAIESDFSDAVQRAHDQIQRCSGAIVQSQTRLECDDGTPVVLPFPLTDVYAVCVLAEHYPALSFQVRQLLTKKHSGNKRSPLILDVFALDTVTEFLSSPMHFVHYLDLRDLHGDRIQGHTELSLLGLHLHQNLWPMTGSGVTHVHDDVCASIEAGMNTRRLGAPGPDTPPGALVALRETPIGAIIEALGKYANPTTIDLGLFLLKTSGKSLGHANSHIARVLNKATRENTLRTATIWSPEVPVGISVQCVPPGLNGNQAILRKSCITHKYRQRAEKWVGIEMRTGSRIAHVLPLHYPWEPDSAMEQMIHTVDASANLVAAIANRSKRKIGRNDPCPCGSGKKFKRCCAS